MHVQNMKFRVLPKSVYSALIKKGWRSREKSESVIYIYILKRAYHDMGGPEKALLLARSLLGFYSLLGIVVALLRSAQPVWSAKKRLVRSLATMSIPKFHENQS